MVIDECPKYPYSTEFGLWYSVLDLNRIGHGSLPGHQPGWRVHGLARDGILRNHLLGRRLRDSREESVTPT